MGKTGQVMITFSIRAKQNKTQKKEEEGHTMTRQKKGYNSYMSRSTKSLC